MKKSWTCGIFTILYSELINESFDVWTLCLRNERIFPIPVRKYNFFFKLASKNFPKFTSDSDSFLLRVFDYVKWNLYIFILFSSFEDYFISCFDFSFLLQNWSSIQHSIPFYSQTYLKSPYILPVLLFIFL